MKKYLFIPVALFALASCSEEAITPSPENIVISVSSDDLDVNVQTKATALGAVPSSLYVQRTTGSGGGETSKDASASMAVAAGKITTTWVQSATPTTFNYYLSNLPINFVAGGSTLTASNTTDVLAGVASDNTITPAVNLEHIFARTGTLTAIEPDGGYVLSGVTWKIQSNSGTGTAGTYDMVSKAWSGTTALAEQAFTSSSDLYLVPGSYKISLTYTLTKGDWTKSTTKSANVTLQGGKINNLKIGSDGKVPLIDGGAEDISVTVTLDPWGNVDVSVPLS